MPRIIRGGLALGAVVFSFAAILVLGRHLFAGESHSKAPPSVPAADAPPPASVGLMTGYGNRPPGPSDARVGTDGLEQHRPVDGTAATTPLDSRALAPGPDTARPASAGVAQSTARSTREQAIPAALLLVIAVVSVVVLLKSRKR
ncbi:hypothetical protein [Mycobacterium sp. EPa45]|uniref:hypothetical protein n=1 Tax=Mycobacterium sp. EPa45 TaxID=1545728 RepID=UPI0006422BEF|nr:hypothetical protein [Mycobacterium sp. EPa45]AKK26738.1 hypothetical protein AB431_08615 [Mycobacterium sp. EPa45]